ncbi:restriction endonuclease subunit S [Sphingobacterium sp. HJSM2_6]|uniref:restriction endonuclease subunit S n=1 Tax=Sphingobacterium sp. HJSM2_6 TaxID=3366264 RepID=UPI003BBCC691
MKQTEIGLIPEEWSLKIVDDVIKFSGGSQPPLYTFSPTKKYGYVRLIQIRDYKTDKYKVYIPQNLGRKFCTKDDIMIGRYGPPIFQILKGIEGAYNVALLKAIPNEDVINKDFAWHFLKSEKLFNFVDKLSQRSSGQTGVDLVELRNYPIPLPPLAEQEAIANALSDADTWIEKLEQLIAKKRLIKQGSMQTLLTPKDDWEVKKLGEVCDCFSGGTPNTSIDDYYNGNINFLGSGDLNQGRIYSVENKISELGLANSSAKLVKPNTLLIAMYGATAGVVAISKIEGAINQAILAVLPFKQYSTEFIYYFFSLKKDWIITTYTQGGQPNLSGGILKMIEIPFPSLSEQERIATILSDMDAEIEALEQQLGKARHIKQGMMQELLTGRTRLV